MPTEPAHPLHVSRLSVIAVLSACGLFLIIGLFIRQTPSPVQPDITDVPEADRWKLSADGRAAKLVELHAKEASQSSAYAWVDQGFGVVRLPIDRAMELTVQEYKVRR